jgi:hypothetical protein
VGEHRQRGRGSPAHPGWDTLPPEAAPTSRPRVLAYTKKRPDLKVTLRSDLFSDPDLQVLEVRQQPHASFLIINLYNNSTPPTEASSVPEDRRARDPKALERLWESPNLQTIMAYPVVIVGD